MAGERTPSKPSFFWQGLLIVLPVVVLVAVGVFSLQQDRRLAQREAEDRAQAIANDLVPLIWNELSVRETNGLQQPTFIVDVNGRLIFPPACDTVPTPKPFDLAALTPEQERQWQMLQSAGMDSQNDESLIQTYEAFIDSDPPANFAAAAHYRLGLWFSQQQNIPEAMERFNLVAEDYPNATGESGLLLRHLALFKSLELQPALVTLESFCSNIVNQPTPLTPYLLQELQERWMPGNFTRSVSGDERNKPNRESLTEMQDTIRKWQRVWDEHELSRELFAASREHFPINHLLSVTSTVPPLVELPRLFWFDTTAALKMPIGDHLNPSRFSIEEQHWLAMRSESPSDDIRYICFAKSRIGLRMQKLLEGVKLLPSYFGVGIELANKPVNEFALNLRVWHYQHYGGKGGHVDREYHGEFATNLLASAAKFDAGANLLKVNVYLTSPTALFQSQRSRAFSFGVLIATATVAAAFGLFAAWQAFNRQLHLSEMKSNFVSSVSHELRAPIASVRLLAESLERGKVSEPAKQNEYFRFIGQECRRLSSLIENVLDFSRIEQGRKQYEFEPTDLGALVEQTVKLMQPYAAERGVTLETLNFEPRTLNLELSVDGRAVQQALVNLIDNAIKHSPKDAVVTVRLETRNAETLDSRPSALNLSVTDHGPGIPASEHEKIFERFYRLGSELRRETQGVGIGLSIVKHIVAAHGGRVRVESEPGKGSRFTIELPLKETTNEHE